MTSGQPRLFDELDRAADCDHTDARERESSNITWMWCPRCNAAWGYQARGE
jgi:hypothetical protein